jgi:hypothetical protein
MPDPLPDASFGIRASRADPPGLAHEPERRLVYGSALVQFEELLAAAIAASPQTRPLSLFYALSQAGRAIAAARLDGEWRLRGHGLVSENLDAGDLCAVQIRSTPSKRGRPGAFGGVCRATGSDLLHGTTTVGELWASLPGLEKLMPELEHPKPLYVAAEEIGVSPLDDVTKVRATVAPLQAKSTTDAEKALASYRHGREAQIVEMQHLAPIHKFTGYGDGVAVWWPSGASDIHGHWIAIGRLAPFDLHTEQHWLRPLVADDAALSDLMTWWALLHALSMVARYEPAAWFEALAYDSSPIAAPIAELLRVGVDLIPQMVLEALYGDSESDD